MQAERLRELASSRVWAAREAAEEVQLVRSGQSLEGPETGRKRHQRDGGRKFRRGGNRLDVCMPGRRCCPRKLTGHDHLSFRTNQSRNRPACGHPLGELWLLSAEVGIWRCGVALRFQKENIRLQLKHTEQDSAIILMSALSHCCRECHGIAPCRQST